MNTYYMVGGDGDPPLAPPPPRRGIWGDGGIEVIIELSTYIIPIPMH
ncbi:MAG: hypothetical protein F6K48_06735 [Okeania sp. SIO3H1]|nr:hypothetical protein [Okeania sp. SIO3H1]